MVDIGVGCEHIPGLFIQQDIHAGGGAAFLITIDTEGDNLWQKHDSITTENARYLPRFQQLCEKYGFKPVYLTNYEMAIDPFYIEFARDVIARGTAEVGMHLHAWNSPPTEPLTADDWRHKPYLIEYSDAMMREKVDYMTRLLEDTFQTKMVSHRAGRWAFDERYARLSPSVHWLRPMGGNVETMKKVVEQTLTQGNDYVEYMLHSSEYMPGGSPTFQNERDIERLYADLEAFFSWLAPQVKGMTLAEYYQRKITQR